MILASCSGLIVSYDRHTGEREWEVDVTLDGTAQSFHGEMLISGYSLYIAPDPQGGHVYLIDALTGDVKWKWASWSGVSSDLFLFDGLLVAVTEENRLTVLDPTVGTPIWRTEAVEGQRVAPVKPTPVGLDGDLIFGRTDGRVSRHTLLFPEPVWELWLDADVTTDLVAHEGFVYLGTLDGLLVEVSPDGEVTGRVDIGGVPTYRWRVVPGDLLIGMTGIEGPDREVVAVDLAGLSVAWRVSAPFEASWTTAQPAELWTNEGVAVLVGSDEPALYALDSLTGEVLWRAETDHPPRTVTADGDELFVGTFDGTLNVYRWR